MRRFLRDHCHVYGDTRLCGLYSEISARLQDHNAGGWWRFFNLWRSGFVFMLFLLLPRPDWLWSGLRLPALFLDPFACLVPGHYATINPHPTRVHHLEKATAAAPALSCYS